MSPIDVYKIVIYGGFFVHQNFIFAMLPMVSIKSAELAISMTFYVDFAKSTQ